MSVSITLSNVALPSNCYSGVHYISGLGAIEELDFDVHVPLFKGHNEIKPFKTFVTFQSDNETFEGRVVGKDVSQENDGTIRIICEGTQGYLKDSWVFPGSKDPDDEEEGQTDETAEADSEEQHANVGDIYTVPGGGRWYKHRTKVTTPPNNSKKFDLAYPRAGLYFSTIVNALKDAHNAFVESRYRITTVMMNDCSNLILQHDLSLAGSTCYDAMDSIATEFKIEWYMKGHVLYCKKKFGTVKGDLKTGLNLNTVSKTEDARDIYTAILPLGGVGYDEKRLSLCSSPCNKFSPGSISGGTLRGYSNIKIGARSRPYIVNEELQRIYGLRIKLSLHDDIVVNDETEYKACRDELLSQAMVECQDLANQVIQVSASAFDFANSTIGGPGPELTVFDYYHVIDYVTGIDMILRLVGKDTNYDDILNPSLTFSLDDRKNSVEPVVMTKYLQPIDTPGLYD